MPTDANEFESSWDDVLAESLAELERRRAAGENLSDDDWIALHADLADVLRDVLDRRRALAEDLRADDAASASGDIPTELEYVGKYKLIKELGSGPGTLVYRAKQEGLGREVAVKILVGAARLSAKAVQRFQREGRVIAKLRHPHIVVVHEVGSDRGYQFLSMELMGGGSLEVLRGKAQDTRKVATWLVQAASAVAHAHQQGVVHRDIKPGNLLLDEQGTLKVADFGLAIDLQDDVHVTSQGDLVGTIAYMSPEQARADRDDVGPASDVFSLGATLYAMLAGVPPFRGQDLGAVVQAITETEPQPLRKYVPWVSRGLQTICHKCLEKAPTQRYPSAQDLADDLQRWLNGEPIHARPPGLIRKACRWSRLHPIPTGVATLAVAALLVFAFIQCRIRQMAYAANLRLEARTLATAREAGWFDKANGLLRQANEVYDDPRAVDEMTALLEGLDAKVERLRDDFGGATVAFSADGSRLLLAGCSMTDSTPSGRARTWNWRNDRVVNVSRRGGIGPATFADDGQALQLVVSSDGTSVELWDVEKSAKVRLLPWRLWEEKVRIGDRAGLPLAISANGKLIAGCIDDQQGAVLVVHDIKRNLSILRAPYAAHLIAFSPDGRFLAAGDQEGQINVWDVTNAVPLKSFGVGRRIVQSAAFCRDYKRHVSNNETDTRFNQLLAVGDSSGTITVFDLADGSIRARLRGSHLDVHALAFDPNGVVLSSASRGELRIWDVASARLLLHLGSGNYTTGLAFSPDGQFLAASTLDLIQRPQVTIWRLSYSRGVAVLPGLGAQIAKVGFSSQTEGGQHALVGALSHNWELGIWEVPSGKLRIVIETPRGWFPDNAAFDFSPKRDRVAFSTLRDAILWDTIDGRVLDSWPLPSALVDLCSFRSDSELIVVRAEQDEVEGATQRPAWPRIVRIRNLLGTHPRTAIYEDRYFGGVIVDGVISADGKSVILLGQASPRGKLELHVVRESNGKWTREQIEFPDQPSEFRADATVSILAMKPRDESECQLFGMPTMDNLGRLPLLPMGIDSNRRWWAGYTDSPVRAIRVFRWGDTDPFVQLDVGSATPMVRCPFNSVGTHLAWGRPNGSLMVADLPEIERRIQSLRQPAE